MSILYDFDDFPKYSASFQELRTVNVAGEVTKSYVEVATGDVWIYTLQSKQTNNQNQFVNDETGHILYIPGTLTNADGESYDITKKLKCVIGSNECFIEGKDDIGRFAEVEVLLYRKDIS